MTINEHDDETVVFYADTDTTAPKMGPVTFSHGPARAVKLPFDEMAVEDAPVFKVGDDA